MSQALYLQNNSCNIIIPFTLCAECGWMPLYFMSRNHEIAPPHTVVYVVAIHHQIDLMYNSSAFTPYRQQFGARSALYRLVERICS